MCSFGIKSDIARKSGQNIKSMVSKAEATLLIKVADAEQSGKVRNVANLLEKK